MQRLAFIIVIPTMLAAGFLTIWGAIKGADTLVATGMTLLASTSSSVVAFYFGSEQQKTLTGRSK